MDIENKIEGSHSRFCSTNKPAFKLKEAGKSDGCRIFLCTEFNSQASYRSLKCALDMMSG